MRYAGSRPMGRLFYWAIAVVLTVSGSWLEVSGATPPSSPVTTAVVDIVYMADGTPAQGNLIITWPAFVTAGGTAVAAGTTNVTLGANGALSVALVPNADATPAGVYYSVDLPAWPGASANRKLGGSGDVAGESGNRANHTGIRLRIAASVDAVRQFGTGGESGQQQCCPSKRTGDNYRHQNVFEFSRAFRHQRIRQTWRRKDTSIRAWRMWGAGNYLSTAGGTMSGPIVLPGDPSSGLQAATKAYVDRNLVSKADLISGLVPANQLGTGTATAGSCLLGNGTWGACGGGSGSGNVSTTPAASQNVAQPEGTQFSTNNLANIRYLTASWNWVQSPADSLSAVGSNTIHLNPCPLGIDISNNPNRPYYVYVAGTGTPETALVTSGTCTSGASSGTIVITTGVSHTAGYTVSSSTSGIQEALNNQGLREPQW